MDTPPNTSGVVPVNQCVGEAYAVLQQHWGLFVPSAIIVTAVGMGAALLSQTPILQLGFALIALLAQSAFTAAIFRKVLDGGYVRPVGMTLGADEFRLFSVALIVSVALLAALFLPAAFVLSTVLARSGLNEAELEAFQQDPEGLRLHLLGMLGPTEYLLFAACAIPALWLMARLFMASAATFGEKRMAIAESWRWTKGSTLRVLMAIVLVSLPWLAVNGLVIAYLSGEGAGGGVVAALVVTGMEVLATLVRVPIIALSAILYLGLRPPAPV